MITNYLSPIEFIVSVKRLPHVQFFIQRAIIPGISLQPIPRPTALNPIFETADRLVYNDLNLSFIVDEKMDNFIEVFNWMHGISFPQNFQQYKNLNESEYGLKSDISIVIHNSNKNPHLEINFKDCFPIALGDITLDTTMPDVQYPEATVTFAYNSYSINKIK